MRHLKTASRHIWQPIVRFPILGLLIGGTLGLAYTQVSRLQGPWLTVALTGSSGLIVGLVLGGVFNRRFTDMALQDVEVNIPHISTMKFVVNAKYRQVAWKLFIETITRVSTQPLHPEHGFLREALDSLHLLFTTTRELLQIMEPSRPLGNGPTVEGLAIRMLNAEMRPFLSKWHPLLTRFEAATPTRPDREWDHNAEFRTELEQLRARLLSYAYAFGQLAEVKDLGTYFPSDFLDQSKGG